MKKLLLAALAISTVLSNANITFASDAMDVTGGAGDDRGNGDAPKRSGDGDESRKRGHKRARVEKTAIEIAEELQAEQAAQARLLEEAYLVALRGTIQARLDTVMTRALRARGMNIAAWLDGKIAEAQAAYREQLAQQAEEARRANAGALVLFNQPAAVVQAQDVAVEQADVILGELQVQGNAAELEEARLAEEANAVRLAAEARLAEVNRLAELAAKEEAERAETARIAAIEEAATREAAEKANTDRLAAEQAAADRLAAQKAEADRLAVQQTAARLADLEARFELAQRELAAAQQRLIAANQGNNIFTRAWNMLPAMPSFGFGWFKKP